VGENIDTIQKNQEVLLDADKDVGLDVNPEKTKYMLRPPYYKEKTKALHKESDQLL
jgi:hypothetical protein